MGPPAMTTPRTSGAGNVSGTLTTTDVFPALVKRSGQVGARIERDETGSLRVTPGLYSRMSKTPCPPGSRPVRNVGQAAQEWDGMQDRETPRRPRSTSLCSAGRSPAAMSGSRTSQSAPSHPMTRALFAMRAEGYRGPTRGSPVPLSDWRRSRLALREPLDGLPQSLGKRVRGRETEKLHGAIGPRKRPLDLAAPAPLVADRNTRRARQLEDELRQPADRRLLARGEVDDLVRQRRIDGSADPIAEILDVEEIAGRGAVAVHHERLPRERKADEVRDDALLVGRDGSIDIGKAERHDGKVEGAREGVAVRLAAQLAGPVGRDRPRQGALVHGRLSVAHDRPARRGEDDLSHARGSRRTKHDEGAPHFDVEVRDRILDGLADRAEGRKVDDGVHALDGPGHGVLVPYVRLDDLDVEAVEIRGATAREVVESADLDAAAEQL